MISVKEIFFFFLPVKSKLSNKQNLITFRYFLKRNFNFKITIIFFTCSVCVFLRDIKKKGIVFNP